MNNIEFSDLQIFCCVARLSSFVGAAQELGISPAFVSKKIAGLEQRMGVTLFNRTTRRVRISTQGEVAYSRARQILEDIERMSDEMSSTKVEASGRLHVSTSLRLGRNHVSPILSRLGKQFPKLEIWLELVNTGMDMIDEGIDIDIRVGEVNEPHLIAHRIVKSERILCAAPSYLEHREAPTTVSELAQHDCLLFKGRDQAFGVWRLNGPGGIESIKVTGRIGSNHSDITRGLALDGYGIIMLSDWDVADDLNAGRFVRVLPQHSQAADVMAVTSSRSATSAKVRQSMEFLINSLRQGTFALQAQGY